MNFSGEVIKEDIFSSVISKTSKKARFIMPTAAFNEEKLTQYREALETKLVITSKQFEIIEAFVQPWYP